VQTEFGRERERIFLIGGDCPGLSQEYFLQADGALDSNDVVIGPAHDGGYVLLGLKRPVAIGTSKGPEGLFTGIAWSSSAVLEQTLGAAQNQNLSVRLLHPLADIDDLASLNAQLELVENIFRKEKETWRWLRQVLSLSESISRDAHQPQYDGKGCTGKTGPEGTQRK
jgi:glycosyltransferase A (GT-A) superfamily protein (DUF2064 family)